MGNKLQKLYFKLLSASILALLCINVISFIAEFNPRQLINPSFFDERVTALYYLAKNIVLETGLNLESVSQDDIDILLEKASDIYDVDKNIAPVIVASGMGHVAEKIIEIAGENKVPIYEDTSLTTILTQLELGSEIPEELYKAVVDIYVFFLNFTQNENDEDDEYDE